MRPGGVLALRLAVALAPAFASLSASATAMTAAPTWQWSGLLVMERGVSLPAGAHVHIAMIDGDCDGLELADYDEVLAAPRRSVAFEMQAPASGHDGHLVVLTAEIIGPDNVRIESDAHFDLISHRWREAPN